MVTSKLKVLGKNGKKLRSNTKIANGKTGKGKVEFLCLGCKNQNRITRRDDRLCVTQMKNGSFRLQGRVDCNVCKRMKKVSLFISSDDAAKMRPEIVGCNEPVPKAAKLNDKKRRTDTELLNIILGAAAGTRKKK